MKDQLIQCFIVKQVCLLQTLSCFTVFFADFIYSHNIIHTLYLQLLLVNCALVSAAAPPLAFWRLCARSVTVICVVVSAVSVLDLSEQFTPPETAPPSLVSLIQAIEKRGISVSASQLTRLSSDSLCASPSLRLCASVSLPPSASCSHASICP